VVKDEGRIFPRHARRHGRIFPRQLGTREASRIFGSFPSPSSSLFAFEDTTVLYGKKMLMESRWNTQKITESVLPELSLLARCYEVLSVPCFDRACEVT